MFLTYPMITPIDETVLSHISKGSIGAPGYLNGTGRGNKQFDNLIALLAQPLEEEELLRAFVDFGYFGRSNPLVMSSIVRTGIATKSSPFYSLLEKRLNGTDRGTTLALRRLRTL